MKHFRFSIFFYFFLCFTAAAAAADLSFPEASAAIREARSKASAAVDTARSRSFLSAASRDQDVFNTNQIMRVESFDTDGDGVPEGIRIDYNNDREWDHLRVDNDKNWRYETVINDADRSGRIDIADVYLEIDDVRDIALGDLDENGEWDTVLVDKNRDRVPELGAIAFGTASMVFFDTDADGTFDAMDANGDGFAETSLTPEVFDAYANKVFSGKFRISTRAKGAAPDADGDAVVDEKDYKNDVTGEVVFHLWVDWIAENYRNPIINRNLARLDADTDSIPDEVDPSPRGYRVLTQPNVTVVTSDDLFKGKSY